MTLPHPPEASVAHSSRGRLRLKVPARRGDLAFFAELGGKLAAAPAVREVETNARTAGILIKHDSSGEALLAWAGDHNLLTPSGQLFTPHRQRPAAEPNWRTLVVLVVLLLAVTQLLRGQILGPATTLAFMAAQIARLRLVSGEAEPVGSED
ncbi:hypothetical protein [Algihabitans albus]|uniref:hypothetical protein n=1 Tax=Algihabitans albus TaxID=2164067 RepID=UPI000E5D7688|nr:hypothetical protein [Algihabitans albus]